MTFQIGRGESHPPDTMPAVIDTHCHLTSPQFAGEGRVDQVLADARAAGVRAAITVSTTTADALAARELARRHERLWFTAGVHPLNCDEPYDWNDLSAAGSDPRCVAWGELGLDKHYQDPPREMQRRVLEEQLAAIEGIERSTLSDSTSRGESDVKLRPIVVHCRDAFDDLLAVFRAAPFQPSRYVFHCFTGGPDDARKVLDFGACISFTGVVTFHNAAEVVAAARLTPADRIMAETDSPFLSPEPVRKVRPNEPKHVVHIARRLAEIRGVAPAEMEQTLDANARRFFAIDF